MRPWPGPLAATLVVALVPVMCSSLKAPVLTGCVFVHKVSVTCAWKPGDSTTTNYTLSVRRLPWTETVAGATTVSEKLWSCQTTNTSCTLEFKGSKVAEQFRVTYNFCTSVTAHGQHRNLTSEPRCQPGITEVMLPPVKLESVAAESNHRLNEPQCLRLNWSRNINLFPFSSSQIRDGCLKSQIEFRPHGQSHRRVSDVTVTRHSFTVCVFRPDTLYSVRLRHRYNSSTSPWSQWSNDHQGTTAEAAPSAAPMFWGKVLHQDQEHRLTSLLWKPLPHALANGRILSYHVTCRDESTEELKEKGNCSSLNISHTSCVLKLPLGPCSCSISASNSVRTLSPRAWVSLSKAHDKEGPAPSQLSVTSLNDRSLEVKWWRPSAALASSVSGFVVEWFAVFQESNGQLHWERVNSSTTAMNITEGVEPFNRYAVSVRALYEKQGAGQNITEFVYTRQGAPSAGPWISDLQVSGNRVNLIWSLPVEQHCGFILNYILFYNSTNQKVKRVVVNGSAQHYSLSLSPGLYEFWLQATTEAGTGKSGPHRHEKIEAMSVVLFVLLPIGLISLTLIVTVCVLQSQMVKGKLCEEIPDPSHSSMANWSPAKEGEMKFTQPDVLYSELVLLNQQETKNCELDLDKLLQSCFYPSTITDYTRFKYDTEYKTVSGTTNMADTSFTSCPAIYPVAYSRSSSLELQHHSYPNLEHSKETQKGDSELCLFNPEGTAAQFSQNGDQDITFPSFCAASESQGFNVRSFSSTPLLEQDAFCQTETLQHDASASLLLFSESFLRDLVDLSQGLPECDPYLAL